MPSSEELLERLISLQRENEQLRTEAAHAGLLLHGLETLIGVEEADPFAGMFHALDRVFAFDQALVLADVGGDQLECVATVPKELLGLRWRVGPFLRRVMAGRVAVTFANDELEEWQDAPAALLSPRQPALYLPIRVRDRGGVLMLLRQAGSDGFDRMHVVLARKFALLASAAFAARYATQDRAESERLRALTERLRNSERELALRAYFDDLTGLPNRALIQQKVEQVLRQSDGDTHFALAFIDLDNFKQINDYYSHAVGDAVLVEMARRIGARIRPSDTLARISGDEFLLLIDPLTRNDQLGAILDRVMYELRQPFRIEGFEIFTSASIGVSIYPAHGRDYESLRRTADSAMYQAKSTHKGSVAYYDVATGQAVVARMELEQRLRFAIRDQRFSCAFQPKFDIRTRAAVGFEALVRWRDEHGMIQAPGEFVGLAVELGLIEQITYAVLEHARAAMDDLDRVFSPGLPISINIAAKQADNVVFMRALIDALRASGQAHRFMLELTEDAFVAHGQFQTHVMPMLRELGVRVSIDDFGIGYSSLSALADITVDEIKVDRSFITDIHRRPRSQSMLKAIESMGRALGIDVVAEGVETADEVAYLLGATSIRHAQGFYFARPMFIEDIVGMMPRAVGA